MKEKRLLRVCLKHSIFLALCLQSTIALFIATGRATGLCLKQDMELQV
eukprot:gene11880-5207_t